MTEVRVAAPHDLTGLAGVGVALVLLAAFVDPARAAGGVLEAAALSVARSELGVDLLFLVLTVALARAALSGRDRAPGLRTAVKVLARAALVTAPVYYAWLALSAVALPAAEILATPVRPGEGLAHALPVANMAVLAGAELGPRASHLPALALAAQLAALVTLAASLVPRERLLATAVSAAAVGIGARVVSVAGGVDRSIVELLPLARLDVAGVGVALAVLGHEGAFAGRTGRLLGVAGVAGSLVVASAFAPPSGTIALIADVVRPAAALVTFGAVTATLISGQAPRRLAELIDAAVPTALGRYAFAIVVVHRDVGALFARYVPAYWDEPRAAMPWILLAFHVATIGVGALIVAALMETATARGLRRRLGDRP